MLFWGLTCSSFGGGMVFLTFVMFFGVQLNFLLGNQFLCIFCFSPKRGLLFFGLFVVPPSFPFSLGEGFQGFSAKQGTIPQGT